jgi:hypothetical protein
LLPIGALDSATDQHLNRDNKFTLMAPTVRVGEPSIARTMNPIKVN